MSNIGHIYKLTCSETKRVYVGSTTGTLQERLGKHRSKGNQCVSRHFINPIIQLIESIEFDSKDKLLWRERFHIETEDCVNKLIPISTKEERKRRCREYDKKYREEHKEEKKERDKKYKEEHKEEIGKKKKAKFNCECGGKYQQSTKARHFKTERHQAFIGSKLESK